MIFIKILLLICIILNAMCVSLEMYDGDKVNAVWRLLCVVIFSALLLMTGEVQNG